MRAKLVSREVPIVACEACGEPFRKTTRNRIYCDDCGMIYGDSVKRNLPYLDRGYQKLKAKLDAQVKIYRAGEYSQEFLKSLIPI